MENKIDVLNDLLKEMDERLKYLETLEKSDENTGRIKEIKNCIVGVQQKKLSLLSLSIGWNIL